MVLHTGYLAVAYSQNATLCCLAGRVCPSQDAALVRHSNHGFESQIVADASKQGISNSTVWIGMKVETNQATSLLPGRAAMYTLVSAWVEIALEGGGGGAASTAAASGACPESAAPLAACPT